jgi:hypothetical protein
MRMTENKMILLSLLGSFAFGTFALAAAETPAPIKPWNKESECSWWLSADDGKSLRASIGQSPDGVVLTLSDLVFKTWSESEFHEVELRFNKDAKRKALAEGWVSLGGGHTSMFGVFLDIAAMKAMDRATLLEVRRAGALVMALPLAATPTKAELEGCVPTLLHQSDSE